MALKSLKYLRLERSPTIYNYRYKGAPYQLSSQFRDQVLIASKADKLYPDIHQHMNWIKR